MKECKFQAVAKARIRRNDPISVRVNSCSQEIAGTVQNVSGYRLNNGAYAQIYIGDNTSADGKWYKMEDLTILDHGSFEREGDICHLSITYHMQKNHGTLLDPVMEEAETCICLPMTIDVADDILTNGENSKHLERRMLGGGMITEVLQTVSIAQGYEYQGFCSAELVLLTDYQRVSEN